MIITTNADESGKRTVTVYRAGKPAAQVSEGAREKGQRGRLRHALLLELGLGPLADDETNIIDGALTAFEE